MGGSRPAAISEVVDRHEALTWFHTYVTTHALAVDGPIRGYYLVSPTDTADQNAWRTQIGWPIFDTGPAATR